MITLNSIILPYNEIKEIDEYKPMLPPDSIYVPENLANKSFQKLIPDKYDLDKIEFNDLKIQRNSAPIKRDQEQYIKNNFYSTIMINNQNKTEKNEEMKYQESYPINIDEKERSLDMDINSYENNPRKKEDCV